MINKDCIFCKIGSGQVTGDLLYKDQKAFVIKDIQPRAPIHLLIIPLQHFQLFKDLKPSTEDLIGHLFSIANKMAIEFNLVDGGFRLIVNQGEDAGQTVPHLHLHLLGGNLLSPLN